MGPVIVFLIIFAALSAQGSGQKDAGQWLEEGLALADSSNYADAIECYDQALKLDPDLAQARSSKGDAQYLQGGYDQSLKSYDKALEIDDSLAAAWQGKGGTLAAKGDHENAIKCYDMAMKLGPPLAGFCLCLKGQSQAALGKSAEAEATFTEALKAADEELNANPNVATCWGTKGAVLAALGRHDEALKCYDRALEINPRDAVVTYYRGLSLQVLGKDDESRDAIEKAGELGYKAPG
ncbi:MAG TPA: tetratricopeptide repeat protein [Methanotrichaceae archaeon]|nr:tetratricopeptide repeat protein [Methanotrichaceae archaeon]